ncbi:MAG: discoidin domain-containing protein [Flavobacteriales bacterium]
MRIGQAELTDLAEGSRNTIAQVLQNLMLHFAAESVNPLGFQYNEELFKSHQQKVDSLLDSVSEKIESLLSNKRRAERKIYHQLKYTDCVSMNENYKSQTLRWGADFNNSQGIPFVAIQLESDTSNVQLTQELRNYALLNDGWHIVSKQSEANDSKGEWRVWNDKRALITASSSWNRKHGPEQGKLNLEEGVANWSTKTNDLKQWIQVDFGEKKLIQKVAIQGRYNREQWVTKFRVQVSLDGKKFEEVGSVFEGNVDQHSIVEVALEPNPVARFVRIVPIEWHGHISMRFDVETKDFREQAFEMKKEILVGNLSEIELQSTSMAEVISNIQNTFKGKFGLMK